MPSWKRSCTGCTPLPGNVSGARYALHCPGQTSGHLPQGKPRVTSLKATSWGRCFLSVLSLGTSGTRSSGEPTLAEVDGSQGLFSQLLCALCTCHRRSTRTCAGSLEAAVAWWSPPLVDTGPADSDNPPLTGFFYQDSLAEGIFRGDHFPTYGICTGGGERGVLVRACHGRVSAR
jgi:hypothetical protein